MAFEVNYEQANSLVSEGTYEAIVKTAYQNTTKNGKQYISIRWVIRNDVEQKHQNRTIGQTLWKRKEPTAADKAVDGFSNAQIQAICKAVQLENGKTYASLDEWLNDLKHKKAQIIVKHEEYNGKTDARVDMTRPTMKPECTHEFPVEAEQTQQYADISDDDLPF